MLRGRSLGRRFGWLWAAYAVSSYGTGFGFGAMAIIAIRVLRAGPGEVSLLSSVGLAAGALLAIPLGPWVEFRRKRPVMVAMDLVRFGAQITVPVAYLLGALTFVQLLLVTIVVAGAKIAFRAASGAHLKALVAPPDLLLASSRFESTTWSSLVVGPPLGGAAIGLFGATVSITADAVSYLLSAFGISMIGGREPEPPSRATSRGERSGRAGFRDLPDGWRYILTHPGLRGLFVNRLMVGSLILCTEPLLSVLMLGRLHFAPWQYGLAFAAPCIGGLVGARLSPRLVARLGSGRALLTFGTFTVGWPIGLAFIPGGIPGLLMVIALQLGLVLNMGIVNPIVATRRLEQIAPERMTRTLSAWTVSTSVTTAAMTALWGLLAELVGLRAAIAAAGVLALPAPLLLPRGRAREPTAARSRCSGGAPRTRRRSQPYFLVPAGEDDGTLRAYALLSEVMGRTDRAALGRFVMRAKEYLAIVRARGGVPSLTTMRFADEVRSTDEIDTASRKSDRPSRTQLQAATAIIEELTTDWEPDRYKDRYRQRLQRVVSRKSKGETIAPPEPPEEIETPPDLMEALERTLAELRA